MNEIDRRAALGGMAGMAIVGMGGTPKRPLGYVTPDQPGVAAGNQATIRARQVIIVGAGQQLLVYSPTAAAGNLVESIASAAFVDPYGNHGLAGNASYASAFAAALAAGFVAFYTGSLAAGWTSVSQVAGDSAGNLQANAAGTLQLVGSGGVAITGSTTINGSSNTGSAGLPDGTIHGTSGAASAGTAHTHSPGSFAVGNGVHVHVL